MWERREEVDLGPLGSGWSVLTRAGLDLTSSCRPLAGVYGRGGIQRCGDVVLRPYRRGGLIRFLAERSYASPRRFEREWEIHRALWEAGFPTVRPLGYGRRRSGLAWEGVYLSAFEEGRPWPLDWDAGRARIPALLDAIRALSAWGLWAPDLNATNILMPEDGSLRLLDWDRAAFVHGQDLVRLYLRRLQRSLRKLQAPESLLAELRR